MTLKEILEQTTWRETEASLRRHYCDFEPDEPDGQKAFVSAHRQVFEALRELDPQPDDTVVVVDVEEDGAGLDFHASGVEAATGEYVSLVFTRWEQWLGMEVAPSTLEQFFSSDVVAHCLYEMALVDYDQESIQGCLEEVGRRADEAMKAGGESALINAEDVFWEEYRHDPERLAEPGLDLRGRPGRTAKRDGRE